MIEVEYYYKHKITGEWKKAYVYFQDVNKAVRFLYKCKSDKYMYPGDYSCDNQWETEEIQRRFK